MGEQGGRIRVVGRGGHGEAVLGSGVNILALPAGLVDAVSVEWNAASLSGGDSTRIVQAMLRGEGLLACISATEIVGARNPYVTRRVSCWLSNTRSAPRRNYREAGK